MPDRLPPLPPSRRRSLVGAALLGLCAALEPAAAQAAAPACTAGTLADYLALGAGGCALAAPGASTAGALRIASVFADLFSRTQLTANPFTAADVRVTPVAAIVAGASYVGLRIVPAIPFGARSDAALALGSFCGAGLACHVDVRRLQLSFTIGALPGASVSSLFVTDFGDGGTPATVATTGSWRAEAAAALRLSIPGDAPGPGVTRALRSVGGAGTERCVQGTTSAACATLAPQAFTAGAASTGMVFELVASVSHDDTGVSPTGFGTADASGATLLFGVTPAVAVVPEPTPLTLMLGVLLPLGLASRARRARRR